MFFHNPQLLWLLLLLPALALIWRWRWGRVSAGALLLRLAAVALLILALSEPSLGRSLPTAGPLVVLVDQSDSLTEAGRTALRAEAQALATRAGSRANLLFFAADVVAGPAQASAAAPLPDGRGSDLAAALRTARALLPAGGQVVLLSDGLQTTGDALAEARLAAAAGITVDVWPAVSAPRGEASIVSMNAPRLLRVGEEFPITIAVEYYPATTGPATLPAHLRLWEGDTLLGEQEVSLPSGAETFTFRHRASTPGIVRLRAAIEPAADGDTFAQNNRAAVTARVAPPPRVLLVEGTAGTSTELESALRRAGVESATIFASQLPTQLSDLTMFDSIVLVDVPAAALTLDQMASVREFVRSEGRGLVAIGGRNAYGLGGYKGTPLEEVLPVQMEPPPRPQRSDIALLLMVDRSASMTAALGVSKFDMAKEAVILASEGLKEGDFVGVLAFDTSQLWAIPFGKLGAGLDKAQIASAIAALPPGGGTDIQTALATGLPALAQQPASVRHAVLLTDGRSFTNDLDAYQQMVETARANRISLSTIAIGVDADTVLLDQLARWGGGRYYFAEQPEDIPRLTLLESEIARADPTVEGTLRAELATPHPLLRDFAPAELPELGGYIATTAKPSAEVVLRSPERDPLLVSWQYGLGRAVAWMPSVGAPWAGAWPRWEGYDRFWAQVVRYTVPDPDSGPLQVRLDTTPSGARLSVDALRPGGEPLDLAAVAARIVLPDGTTRSFSVAQDAPGHYSQDLGLETPGAYAASVVLLRDGERQEAEAGYVHPVPAEYRVRDDGEQGRSLLAAIAALTGGSVRAALTTPADDTAQASVQATPPLWPWLLAAALLLWVVEIALRRGLFISARLR